MTDGTPIYNLKAVMREVGLSAATLRAWEGRYGLPNPHRTAGGHRLYSRQDIETLKWLIEKQKEGLSISRAVELWKTMTIETERAPIHKLTPALEKKSGEAVIDELRTRWITACYAFDELSANQILDQAFAIAAPETVCVELLQKGLADIGDRWYRAKFSVQQEHFASAIAMRRINSLLTAVIPPTRASRILAACPPGEQHEFILLLVTYLLRRHGWDVVYLGSNTPLKDLDITIRSTKPALIISAAQTINSAASLKTLSEAVNIHHVPLGYGGGIFTAIPSLTQYISGHYLGGQVESVADSVEKILKSPGPTPPAMPVQPNLAQMFVKFLENESNITTNVALRLKNSPIDPDLLNTANSELSQMISSALCLGNIDLLDYSADWLYDLLNNYNISQSQVRNYYSAYQESLDQILGEDGALIRNWLDKQIRTHQ